MSSVKKDLANALNIEKLYNSTTFRKFATSVEVDFSKAPTSTPTKTAKTNEPLTTPINSTASTDAQKNTTPPAIKPMTTNSDTYANETLATPINDTPLLQLPSIASNNTQTPPIITQQISPIHQIPSAFTNQYQPIHRYQFTNQPPATTPYQYTPYNTPHFNHIQRPEELPDEVIRFVRNQSGDSIGNFATRLMRRVFKVTERQGRNVYGTNKVINGRRVIKESLERNKLEQA